MSRNDEMVLNGEIDLGLGKAVRCRHLVEVFHPFFLPFEAEAFGIGGSFRVGIIHYCPNNDVGAVEAGVISP